MKDFRRKLPIFYNEIHHLPNQRQFFKNKEKKTFDEEVYSINEIHQLPNQTQTIAIFKN